MKANTPPLSLQDRFQELAEQLQGDPLLASLLSPQELADFLQDGFSRLLNTLLLKQRDLHLQHDPTDRGNGFAPPRTLFVQTVPVSVQRPRTREGFYPSCLPKHQRHLPDSYRQLLEQVLLYSRSFNACLRTLQSMGLGASPQELEIVLAEIEQEAEAFHSRPLASDWLVLYIDAKVVSLKDEHDQVRKAVHFLVIGLNLEARKEILCSRIFWGNEAIDCWRQVLLALKNRGLTRVLLVVTDDFPGLEPLLRSLLPGSDHQLCTVHLLRNARRHLSPTDYQTFHQTWQEICSSSSFDTAREKWQALLLFLNPDYSSYAQHLESRTEAYLTFMHYPRAARPNLRTTNLPEGLNNLIENIRRNSGGHFHSEREVKIKMKILFDQLYRSKWSKPHPTLVSYLQHLTQSFRKRFEQELPPLSFLTPNS